MNFTNISSILSKGLTESPSIEALPHISASSYLSKEEIVGVATFLCFFGFVGFMENLLLIISIILGDGCLEAPSNLFILSLGFADLLICCVSAPLLVYNFYRWIFNAFIVVSKFIVVAASGSIFLLTLNRLISILWALRYHYIMTIQRAALMVALTWAMATFVVVGSIVNLVCDCGINSLSHVTKYFLAGYIISTSLMYIYLYILSRKHRRLLKEQIYSATGQIQNAHQEFRSLRTLLMVAGTSAACWLPMTISLFFTNRFVRPLQFHRAFAFTAPLVVVNSVLDPMIFYYRSKGFRSSLRTLFKRLEEFWYQ